MKIQKHTRRYFIKSAIAGLVIGTAVLWDRMVYKQRTISAKKYVSIPYNPNLDISFHDEFIVITKNNKIDVLSSRCTHLGCKINHQSESSLVCPCHGSSFDFSGNVSKGPALVPLKKLDFEFDSVSNNLTVKV